MFDFVVRFEIILIVKMLLARQTIVMPGGVGPVLLQRRVRSKLPAAVVAPIVLTRGLSMLLQRVFAYKEAVADIAVGHAVSGAGGSIGREGRRLQTRKGTRELHITRKVHRSSPNR